MEIEQHVFSQLSPVDSRAALELIAQSHCELWPLACAEEARAFQAHRLAVDNPVVWLGRKNRDPIAIAWGRLGGPAVVPLRVFVIPAWRRRRCGRQLFRAAASSLRRGGVRQIVSRSASHVSGSNEFALSLGGVEVGRRLKTEVPLQLLQARAQKLSRRFSVQLPEFSSEIHAGRYSESIISDICLLRQELIGTYSEPGRQTPSAATVMELLRQEDHDIGVARTTRWTIIVRHTTSGDIAGLSEYYVSDHQPSVALHGGLVVKRCFRGLGLDWLLMLAARSLWQRLPALRRIRYTHFRHTRRHDVSQYIGTAFVETCLTLDLSC